jgi:hypothetical protein
MSILPELQAQKGCLSSSAGKILAEQVLAGDLSILHEAVDLVSYQLGDKKAKSIRSGAAKIVEIVAEKKPELVEAYLSKILPGLTASEPQTRWMAIRIMGFCARVNPQQAAQAIPFAEEFLAHKTDGLCLASSADLFLGEYGALSRETAGRVFPLLDKSTRNAVPNEQDWILEAFTKILDNLSAEHKKAVIAFAQKFTNYPRKSTQLRAKTILKKVGTG